MRKVFVFTLLIAAMLALGLPWAARKLAQPPLDNEGTMVRLYRHSTGEIISIPLEEYVTGVVAAEMPAEFPAEALKAQAVAARTYIYKRMAGGGVINGCKEGADTCDDPAHAQAWLPAEEMKKRWGKVNYYRYYYKIRMAVDATAGEIITYNGQPIDPVFHASCGGWTENSGDVWKYDVPYLKSVACPYDADPEPERRVTFSLSQLSKAVGVDQQAIAVSTGQRDNMFQVLERTATGRPKTLVVGDRSKIAATDIRRMLNLRSTNFTITSAGNKVTFTTRGYGHGVGMCQYGAKGFAEHGYDYKKIIKHYYTGVEINSIFNK
ncbi:stage II sporulation protein D [Desulfotruncus alcoholivorax]|uniref:stage II sporulation protein D n=1 Tax=Desulfotruncus alcoholivorax TaxID=265477 RepID=UPI0003F98E0F|nr:stage II sporulation protein D [Desulfotruncus alcoholivorax]